MCVSEYIEMKWSEYTFGILNYVILVFYRAVLNSFNKYLFQTAHASAQLARGTLDFLFSFYFPLVLLIEIKYAIKIHLMKYEEKDKKAMYKS